MTLSDRLSALSPEQRALFEKLRQKQAAEAAPPSTEPPPVQAVSGPLGLGDWPLSLDQERIWQLHEDDPDLVSWNVDAGSYASGDLDLPLFRAALDEVVRRHAAWRTTFPRVDGQPVQRVVPWLAPAVWLFDVSALPPERRDPVGRRAVYEHTRKPFDLVHGPLVRMSLVRLAPREYLYLITIHHLVTDWIAYQIFLSELLTIYAAYRAGRPSPLPPPALQFPDYALWERARWQSEGEALAREARFWQRELAGFPTTLDLPADRPRPPVQSQRGGVYHVSAGAARTERLRALARAEGATTFMATLAVVATLLWRLTGLEKVVVGSNGANRPRPELLPVAGLFLNQIPFAVDLSGDPTFRQLVGRCRKTALAAYSHQFLPFSRLIEILGVAKDRSRYPVVQAVLLVLEVQTPEEFAGLDFRPILVFDDNSRWDLMFGLYDHPREGLTGPLEYNADLFDEPTAGRYLALFYALMDRAVADPDAPISTLPTFAACRGDEPR